MKERPILFSGSMVRALLAGTKTQTRRAFNARTMTLMRAAAAAGEVSWFMDEGRLDKNDLAYIQDFCPYGQPGDRLWVREAFDFMPAGGPNEPQACEIVYWATGSHESRTAPADYNPMIYGHEKVRPSIHMPRWASRITLEITEVRVERLQDISDEDSLAEGIYPTSTGLYPGSPRAAYQKLWEQINGPGSWEANPWVWVVEFKKLEQS